jgi:hypothetical protein
MSITLDQLQEQKLEEAKKAINRKIVYEIAKHYQMLYCDVSVFEYAEFICQRLNICFIGTEEWKLIEQLHKMAQENN